MNGDAASCNKSEPRLPLTGFISAYALLDDLIIFLWSSYIKIVVPSLVGFLISFLVCGSANGNLIHSL